jgi:hypothetical protein
LVVPSGSSSPRLYRNDLATPRPWLTVSLEDPTRPGNRWGDGARVEVVLEDGDAPVVGTITTSGSYESQKPPVAHFGLGDLDGPVSEIRVYWPGTTQAQVLNDVETDQQLVVSRTGGEG